MVSVYADFPRLRASDYPQATIPPFLLIIPYRSDIVLYNEKSSSVTLLELTCPLDLVEHLESVRDHKQGKKEYQEMFDCLEIFSFYSTVELSVLRRSLLAILFIFFSKLCPE